MSYALSHGCETGRSTGRASLTSGPDRNRDRRFIYSCRACAAFISRSPENRRPTIRTTRRSIRERRDRRPAASSNSSCESSDATFPGSVGSLTSESSSRASEPSARSIRSRSVLRSSRARSTFTKPVYLRPKKTTNAAVAKERNKSSLPSRIARAVG